MSLLIKQASLPLYKKCTYCDGRGKVWRDYYPSDPIKAYRKTILCPRCKGARCILAQLEKDQLEWNGRDRWMGKDWRDHRGGKMK